jgi:NAD(P)-dependent dehydrogenase (short-subunit alcohol dehydrogenase family)
VKLQGKTAIVTGASSGIGAAIVRALRAEGARVAGGARRLDRVDADIALELDVTDPESSERFAAAAAEQLGGVDVLVNNAGYGYRAAVEEGDERDVQRLFATNVFGAVAMIKAVLPGMRERRSGAIVNISSIGARITPAGSGYYAATKAALEGLTGSLRKELEPLGITAMVVEPGGFRTDFSGRSLQQSADPIADYADTAGRRRKEHDTTHGTQAGDPAKAAKAIIDVVGSDTPPALLLLGEDAVTAFRRVLDAERAELEAWEHVSLATTFDAAAPDH